MKKSNELNIKDIVLIFVHIHKTGGTTLRRILESNFRKEEIFYVSNDSLPKLESLKDKKQIRYRCFIAHMGFGIHRYLPKNCNYRYIVLLREPVKRIISFYNFYRERPLHYLHKEVKGMGLAEFMHIKDTALANKIQNAQTRQLCGDENVLVDWLFSKKINEDDLKDALKNLKDDKTIVGLTESFDAFLVLLKKKLHLKNLYYFRRNVAKTKANKTLPEQAGQIRKYLDIDSRLYDAAKRKFSKEVSEIEDFEKEAADFSLKNNRRMRYWVVFNWLIEFYERLKTYIRIKVS